MLISKFDLFSPHTVKVWGFMGIMKMFELATDFSKRTVYPEFLDIDPNWDYEESKKQATRYIKTLTKVFKPVL